MTDISEKLERVGQKIILPADPMPMSIDDAIKTLNLIKKEEETMVMVMEEVDAFPLEGAAAMMKAMTRIYGWATPLPGGFFKAPPQVVSMEVGFRKTEQVIWGRFALPNIEGELSCASNRKDNRLLFFIGGQVKKKHMPEIKKLADETRRIVLEESIYRGKAVKLNTNMDGNWSGAAPSFLDLSKAREEETIFSKSVQVQLTTNLYTPITHTKLCKELEVPLKRGVLLEGPYGVGKTLLAFVTAKKCVQNNWTFIMVDRVSALREALQFANGYTPAVVFAEDIDREMTGEERTQRIDDILNTIDGVTSKGADVISILTTNHVERINKAMLRPGRLDAIITIEPPDEEAAIRLVKLYSRGMLANNEDMTPVGETLKGQIPAVIREVVERSKLYAISRSQGDQLDGISARDLVLSAEQMNNHLKLLNHKDDEEETPEQRFANSFMELFGTAMNGNDTSLLDQIRALAGDASTNARQILGTIGEVPEQVARLRGSVENTEQTVNLIARRVRRKHVDEEDN